MLFEYGFVRSIHSRAGCSGAGPQFQSLFLGFYLESSIFDESHNLYVRMCTYHITRFSFCIVARRARHKVWTTKPASTVRRMRTVKHCDRVAYATHIHTQAPADKKPASDRCSERMEWAKVEWAAPMKIRWFHKSMTHVLRFIGWNHPLAENQRKSTPIRANLWMGFLEKPTYITPGIRSIPNREQIIYTQRTQTGPKIMTWDVRSVAGAIGGGGCQCTCRLRSPHCPLSIRVVATLNTCIRV